MVNRISKILIAIILLGSVLFCNFSYCIDDVESLFTTSQGTNNGITKAKDATTQLVASAIGLYRIFGIGISGIIVIVYGIKYITSSLDDKADLKKNAVYYVVGIFVLLGSTFIVGLLQDVLVGIFSGGNSP